MIRVLHPFPSVLDGVVTGAIGLLAGATLLIAVVLGFAMTTLQFAIGAVNDLHDAPADARSHPEKPLASGHVAATDVRAVAWLSALVGLTLSALLGIPALLVALAGLLTGLAYDLRLKGTPWSWLPFAVGIPLLPAYAWIGATGTLPSSFVILLPLASAAGAALAVGNALGDLERDRVAGTGSIAVRLGPTRSRIVLVALNALVIAGALATVGPLGGTGALVLVAVVGAVVIGIGAWLTVVGGRSALRHAWEVQAVGTGILAVGWVGAIVAAGGL